MKFKKGNKFIYLQDFSVYQGIPDDIDFKVTFENNEKTRVSLEAFGYGQTKPWSHGSYGNGKIYITKDTVLPEDWNNPEDIGGKK